MRLVRWGIPLLVGAWALTDAWRRAWVCDDAFISFRYARNLTRGLGLVFNEGERVEGYTNFLWTLLSALALQAGLDPVRVSQGLGLACFAALIALLAWAGRSIESRWGGATLLPLAAVAWALHFHARIYATSGLETALFTLLAAGTVLAAGLARGSGGWALAGWLGVLTALTRPDGMIFLGLAGLAALVEALQSRKLSPLLCIGAPCTILLLYAAWKLSFYGDLRPNTYYAKSADRAWWGQGLAYLGYYFQSYWPLLLGLPLSAAAALRGPVALRRLSWLLLLAPSLYLLYMARVGGDFMFARFCIPASPLLLLGAEVGVGVLAQGITARLAGLAFVIAVMGAPRPDPDQGERLGISDEWEQYPPALVERAKEVGEALAEVLADTRPPARVVIYGYQAMLAYYADFPLVIEGVTGLTDAFIARQQMNERGRPGHEKKAPPEYLMRRGVHFLIEFPVPLPPGGYTEVGFGPVQGRLITYDRALMQQLGQRGVKYTPFEPILDSYIAGMDAVPAADLASDYAIFRGYYFAHNHDPEREAPFLKRLRAF